MAVGVDRVIRRADDPEPTGLPLVWLIVDEPAADALAPLVSLDGPLGTPAVVAARMNGSTTAEDVRHHGVHPHLPAGGGAQEHVVGH